jgi:hypothetical protein
MATPVMAGSDIQPRAVAELLDRMVQATLEEDREVAQILGTARDSLHALAWNRWARHLSAQSTRRASGRRRQAREGAHDA